MYKKQTTKAALKHRVAKSIVVHAQRRYQRLSVGLRRVFINKGLCIAKESIQMGEIDTCKSVGAKRVRGFFFVPVIVGRKHLCLLPLKKEMSIYLERKDVSAYLMSKVHLFDSGTRQ